MRVVRQVVALLLGLGPALASAQQAVLEPRQAVDLVAYQAAVERAWTLYRADSLAAALPYFERAVSANPLDPYLRNAIADVYERSERCPESVTHRLRALSIGEPSGRGVTYFKLARCRAKLGDTAAALASLDSALAAGLEWPQELRTVPAFEQLQGNARFRAIVRMADTDSGLSRAERWRRDLSFFVAEAQRLHVSVLRGDAPPPSRAPAFLAAVQALHDRIPDLSDARINLELHRLAVLLGDGHTGVSLRLGSVPLHLYWFADGLHVVGVPAGAVDWTGARVERIGTLSAAEAMAAVAPYVQRDNDMGLLVRGPRLLAMPQVLHAVGATPDTGSAIFALRTRDGALHSVMLEAQPPQPRAWSLPAPPRVPPPLYLRDTTLLTLEPLPANSTLYVRYGEVGRVPGLSMRKLGDTILASARNAHARHLVLDIRQNTGGETALFPPLVTALAEFARTPGHQVYAIVGRLTFSAAQNLAAMIERFVPSTRFVGEPTGSRPNFVGESTPITLPYSGLRAILSSRFNQNTDFNDDRAWVQVEWPTPLTAADYFAGRDPALEGILRLQR